MKRLIILLSLTIFWSFVFAQNISDIEASFCNNPTQETNLDIITESNKETEICVNFKNNSLKDINFSIEFVDWVITPQWNKACLSSEKSKTNFWQHILDYENSINIPAQKELQKTYKIKFPVWFSGVSHWCLAYNINNDNVWWIGLVFRKVHTIDILVWGTKIDSKIQINNISLNFSWFSNQLDLNLTNNWNIDQTIELSWTISNVFWYTSNFKTEKQIIKAQENLNIITNIKNIPSYKWLFKIETKLSYKPIFNFDITNHNIPNEYIIPGIITITKSIILRNFYYIGVILIILILIYIIIKKYKK